LVRDLAWDDIESLLIPATCAPVADGLRGPVPCGPGFPRYLGKLTQVGWPKKVSRRAQVRFAGSSAGRTGAGRGGAHNRDGLGRDRPRPRRLTMPMPWAIMALIFAH
jgi:hypothetical protein